MSYLDLYYARDEHHDHFLCSPSEINSLVFDAPYVIIVIHIPAHRNETIGHFTCLLVDRLNTYFSQSGRGRIYYEWYDPIGKPPEFYNIHFPYECEYDSHVSYMKHDSRSSGYHVLHYIEHWYQRDDGDDTYTELMGNNGAAVERKVRKQMKKRLENMFVNRTPQKLLLPAEKQEVVRFFNTREE